VTVATFIAASIAALLALAAIVQLQRHERRRRLEHIADLVGDLVTTIPGGSAPAAYARRMEAQSRLRARLHGMGGLPETRALAEAALEDYKPEHITLAAAARDEVDAALGRPG
jgi:hypothetical protein